MSKYSRIAAICAIVLLAATVRAGVPQLINYQGTVFGDGNLPLNGEFAVTFRVYDAENGGSVVWEETQDPVIFVNGLFSVLLGNETPIESSLTESPDRWLGITIGADSEMAPRLRLTSSPFALHAAVADVALSGGGSGLTLPYSGTVEYPGTAFRVTNTDTVTNDTWGAFFSSASPNGRGVGSYATYTGAATNFGGSFKAAGRSGIGVIGQAGNTAADAWNIGGKFIGYGGQGYGVWGESTSENAGVGGRFVCSGEWGTGVHAVVPSYNAIGLKAENMGGGIAIQSLGRLDVLRGAAASPSVAIFRASTTGEYNGDITFQNGDGSNAWLLSAPRVTSGNDLAIFADNGAGWQETFRIDKDTGNVGVHVADPDEKLTVDGSLHLLSGGVKFADGSVQTSAGGGLELPFEAESANSGYALTVRNTYDGSYINPNELPTGGHFESSLGPGVAGIGAPGVFGSGPVGVRGEADGNDVRAIEGVTTGMRNIGVFGSSTYDGWQRATHYGGWFEANGLSGIGLRASGTDHAASFYGDVNIYSREGDLAITLDSGLDYAEGFNVVEDVEIESGTVMALDPDHPGELAVCRVAYDRKVAGVVAGANGLGSGVTLGDDEFNCNIALAGRIYCKVFDPDHDIAAGDLLTTSDVAGYARKAVDWQRSQGAVLGKAMEALPRGRKDKILVMITLQ